MDLTNTQTPPPTENRQSFLYKIKFGRDTAESGIEGFINVSVKRTMSTLLLLATTHNSSNFPFKDLTLAMRTLGKCRLTVILTWGSGGNFHLRLNIEVEYIRIGRRDWVIHWERRVLEVGKRGRERRGNRRGGVKGKTRTLLVSIETVGKIAPGPF